MPYRNMLCKKRIKCSFRLIHTLNFFEYKIKDKPPYLWFWWWGRKKITFYVMLHFDIKVLLWQPKEVEITTKEGIKKKVLDTRMKIELGGGYITDYDGDFEKSPGLKKVETFLNHKILYHENLLKYFDYLDYYMYDFMTDIKKYLEMETASNAY